MFDVAMLVADAMRDVGTWAPTQSVSTTDATNLSVVRTGGAAAIISFHSGEDRRINEGLQSLSTTACTHEDRQTRYAILRPTG